MSSADGASLVAAAVRAAILAKAPRRTVAAVAAAVAGAFVHRSPAQRPAPTPRAPTGRQAATPPAPGDSPEELLQALRAERQAQRRRKKERRRANRVLRAGTNDAGDDRAVHSASVKASDVRVDTGHPIAKRGFGGAGRTPAMLDAPCEEPPCKVPRAAVSDVVSDEGTLPSVDSQCGADRCFSVASETGMDETSALLTAAAGSGAANQAANAAARAVDPGAGKRARRRAKTKL